MRSFCTQKWVWSFVEANKDPDPSLCWIDSRKMDKCCGSRLQGRSRPSPEKQGHLRRRREFCLSSNRDNEEEGLATTSLEKWDPDSVVLGVAVAEEGIQTRCLQQDKEKTRHVEDLKEISGSRHYKEGDLEFWPVPEKKKSIADVEEEDAAHSLSPTRTI
ncbi:hypothetical protein MRB53_014184 [Persea americana]|uniref:Uncharacterized protein n=1 Tax=Persea americana TaxID=3435 RepID=A0ACC2KAS1_PERAE|nr:hypothetical protein MRB53_014184 [Persea americana]